MAKCFLNRGKVLYYLEKYFEVRSTLGKMYIGILKQN